MRHFDDEQAVIDLAPRAETAAASAEARARGEKWPSEVLRALSDFAARAFPLLLVTVLPLWIARDAWLSLWRGTRPRAWDGSGHYAIAQLYDRSIFPDTFGWTHAYFGGMPFPNFYPPLYFWCVSFLSNTRLLTFDEAFKLVSFLPLLLTPAAIWLLTWGVTGKNRAAASGAAFASLVILLDVRVGEGYPAGLDYESTFQIGLYSQPLGFVLLLVWFVLYRGVRKFDRRFVLASLLLALTVLANFFNAVVATVFVAAVICDNLLKYRKAVAAEGAREGRLRALAARAASPAAALALTLFWVAPVLLSYKFFVTRPQDVARHALSPTLMVWYVAAFLGAARWLRCPSGSAHAFLAACMLLAAGIFSADAFAPGWFPLQSPRFLATLNLLLAVPVGYLVPCFVKSLTSTLSAREERGSRAFFGSGRRAEALALVVTSVVLCVYVSVLVNLPKYSFYQDGSARHVESLLSFAREHRAGRYIVETPNLKVTHAETLFDGRALSAFLGAQGNEVLSVVYHEASPNALFFLPLVNAFSTGADNFGVSSVLSDDSSFLGQPLSSHLSRARMLGVKYLVVASSKIKNRLDEESGVTGRRDFGPWSVYEIAGEPPRAAQPLLYKPALVVSDYHFKLRRRSEYDFVRLAQEQFNGGWFDVLLTLSETTKLDRLQHLDRFGALVVGRYKFDDEERAFRLLRDFARTRLLILLSCDSAFCGRLRAAKGELPHAVFFDRAPSQRDEWVGSPKATEDYRDDPIRAEWSALRALLDGRKIPVDLSGAEVSGVTAGDSLGVNVAPRGGGELPVLIRTTYSPYWRREDGGVIYAATPFYMLTFADGPVRLTFERGPWEKAGAFVSLATLILLAGLAASEGLARRRGVRPEILEQRPHGGV